MIWPPTSDVFYKATLLIIIAIFHTHGGKRLKEYSSIFLKALIFQMILMLFFIWPCILIFWLSTCRDICATTWKGCKATISKHEYTDRLTIPMCDNLKSKQSDNQQSSIHWSAYNFHVRQLEKHAKRQSANMNKICAVEHTVKRSENIWVRFP